MLYFLHINKQEISIYSDSNEIHAKKYFFPLCCAIWASYWHIDCKINWEKAFIEADPLSKRLFLIGFLLGFNKEVQKEPLKAGV